jgi:hypothetical protein
MDHNAGRTGTTTLLLRSLLSGRVRRLWGHPPDREFRGRPWLPPLGLVCRMCRPARRRASLSTHTADPATSPIYTYTLWLPPSHLPPSPSRWGW